MPSYVLPQALIYQEFTLVPTALTEPLRACIVGPQYALFRYSEATEKVNIKVTDNYNPDADEAFVWPGRPAGGVVDEDYTKVYIDDALLQYHEDPGGDGSEITSVDGYRNRIYFSALVLQTKNGFSRSAAFGSRDVAVGDVLDIVASNCGEAYRMRARILELVADVVAAVVGDATQDVDNKATQVEAGSGVQTAGDINLVCVEDVDASAYDGRADGEVSETYLVEVISGSSGGDAQGAVLRVTSQSGTDPVAEIVPEDFGTPTPIGSRGATVTFNNDGCGASSSSSAGAVDQDDFLVGQIFAISVAQDYVAPDPTSGGVFLGAADTSYIAEVTRGGDFGTAEITVRTTTGVDASGPTIVTALSTAVAIGTQGTTLTFTVASEGLCLGDRFVIPVQTATEGAVKTAVLSVPLPPGLRGICEVVVGSSSSSSSGAPPDLAVTFYIEKDIEVAEDRVGFAPLVNWEQSATQITLKSGIVAYDASWTSGGVMQPLPVKDGEVYVEYRALIQQWVGTVGTISDVSEIADTFDEADEIDQDNDLVFGVYNALLNSNGTPVKFTAVGASSPITLEDWVETLEVLRGRDDVYSLVPLTQLKTVQDAFVAHVEAMSSPEVGRWRITWLNSAVADEEGIYLCSEATGAGTCDTVLATITDDPNTTGTQYTLVTADGEKFISGEQDIAVGDILRCNYQGDGFGNDTYEEYVIDAILNEEELRLVSGPSAAVNVPSKIEIWRTLNKTEQAEDLALKPGLWSSRRAYLVWPDEVGNAGEVVPGYYLCCSLAGLRSASLPHRPLTNVEILGWDDLSKTVDYFTDTQLNTMAASGYWIVTQDPNDGQVFTRHQLSTNNLDLNRQEQSVTTNVDSISYTFLRRLAVYIGRGNVTPIMLGIIEGEILSILDYFSNFVAQDILGPQVITYSIQTLEQHPLLQDRILAIIPIEVPYPLNNIELHLVV
jgi:hypothetical protein